MKEEEYIVVRLKTPKNEKQTKILIDTFLKIKRMIKSLSIEKTRRL